MAALAATRNLISIEEALRLVLERVRPLAGGEQWHRGSASGECSPRTRSRRSTCHPFDSSAMDGFALRSSDTPGRLPVVHRIAAGTPAPRSLEAGEAMGIATGAVVPEGADAVIPFEYVVENDNDDRDRARRRAREQTFARREETSAPATTVVEAGARLEARHLAALAAAGIAEVRGCPEAAGRRRRDGQRAAPAWRGAGTGTDLRGERNTARGAAGLGRRRGREGELGRGRGGSPSGGSRARARRGRPRDLGRRLGRAARSRAGDPGRARRRGGVLGRLREAGQADLVRRRRATGSSSACPGTRSPCSSASSSSSGPALLALQGSADPGPRFERGVLGCGTEAEPGPRRARTRPGSATVRRPGRRAARGPRIAHDRAGSERGRARPHSTWKRRAGSGRVRRVSPPLRADGPLLLLVRALAASRREHGPAHESPRRPEARPFGRGRIRRIAPGGDRRRAGPRRRATRRRRAGSGA